MYEHIYGQTGRDPVNTLSRQNLARQKVRPSPLRTAHRSWIGIDPASAQTGTAVAVIERAEPFSRERDPLTWSFQSDKRFHVCHAECFPSDTPPENLIEHIRRIAGVDSGGGRVQVIVAASDANCWAVNPLRTAGLPCPVLPLAMDAVDLIAELQPAIQKRFLKLIPTLHTRPELRLALALAWWKASRDQVWSH